MACLRKGEWLNDEVGVDVGVGVGVGVVGGGGGADSKHHGRRGLRGMAAGCDGSRL